MEQSDDSVQIEELVEDKPGTTSTEELTQVEEISIETTSSSESSKEATLLPKTEDTVQNEITVESCTTSNESPKQSIEKLRVKFALIFISYK